MIVAVEITNAMYANQVEHVDEFYYVVMDVNMATTTVRVTHS